jgi:hypothetical protein
MVRGAPPVVDSEFGWNSARDVGWDRVTWLTVRRPPVRPDLMALVGAASLDPRDQALSDSSASPYSTALGGRIVRAGCRRCGAGGQARCVSRGSRREAAEAGDQAHLRLTGESAGVLCDRR